MSITTWNVTVNKINKLTNRGDFDMFIVHYEIIGTKYPKSLNTLKNLDHGIAEVKISCTLKSIWGIDESLIRVVIANCFKQMITNEVIRTNIVPINLRIDLNSSNSPPKCPFNKELKYFSIPFSFEINNLPIQNSLSGINHNIVQVIIDLRDRINAIYYTKFKSNILVLPQERAIVDLANPCSDEIMFKHLAVALAGLVVAISTDKFQTTGVNGSVNQFALFISSQDPEGEKSKRVIETMKAFNQIRRMYPVHTDKSEGVLEAFRYFGIPYPIINYQQSWNILLGFYKTMLEDIHNLFSTWSQ